MGNRIGNNVVYILGDSVIKHINGRNVSDSNVKVRYHPGATTEDVVDYVKPKMLVIRKGTNNLLNDLITIKKMKKVIINEKIWNTFPGIIDREDNNFAENFKERKTKV